MGIMSFTFYYVPHQMVQDVWDKSVEWSMIIAGGAMAVGAISMIRTYIHKSFNRTNPNRYYSMLTLISLTAMTVIGLFGGGIEPGSLFDTIFTSVLSPLESTMFSLLAFYISSAAFRSFRLKSFSAGLLLAAALLVMIAQIPLGEVISPWIPKAKDWLLNYPNVAAQRAIMIGIAIGGVSTALKIILGIDKSVFSGSGK